MVRANCVCAGIVCVFASQWSAGQVPHVDDPVPADVAGAPEGECLEPDRNIVSANPPLDNPFVPGVQAFVDPLQNRGGVGLETVQGIGDPVDADAQDTPDEGGFHYSAITFTLDGPACPLTTKQVTVTCTFASGVDPANPLNDCPVATAISGEGAGPYELTLSGPIPAGACTVITIEHVVTPIIYGALPRDVSGNGTNGATDPLVLVGLMNNNTCPLGPCAGDYCARCDIDRSGSVGPNDLLRAVGLGNGVNTTQVWRSVNLPGPCP